MGLDVELLVQAGALGLLFFVLWAFIFRVMPENRKANELLQENFISAIERHEVGHRDEITTIVKSHERALDKATAGQEARTAMLAEMKTHMKAQTDLIKSVMRAPSSRTRRGDSG